VVGLGQQVTMATRKSVEVTEPEVIDIPLIEDSIVVVGGEEMANESKTLRFEEVMWLKLSFKNIVRIENLMGLHSLEKLQLDNNHIRQIENLDHLLNLTWLDLSFNHIEKIEGLETLTKITDLCLTHNNIKKIEGISTLHQLEIFSCANNEITQTDELQTLRDFEKLRVVNFQNNPVQNDPEYQPVLLAFLPHLKYLDFRLVDDEKVQQAQEQYFTELQHAQLQEQEAEKKKKQEREAAETEARHAKANIPGVGNLLENMLIEDMEGEKLKLFPDFEDALEDFRDAFADAWEKYEKQMLELDGQKDEEKAKFYEMYYGAIEAVDQNSKAMIADYKQLKKKTNQTLNSPEFKQRAPERVTAEQKELLKELRSRTESLKEKLLELEMFQIEQYEDLIGQFEEKYNSIKSYTLDCCRVFFERMRDMQNEYFEKVKEKAKELLEKFQAQEPGLSLKDEALQVLADKDAFMTGVVTGSHEFRLSKIDAKDEELTKREIENYDTLTETIQSDEGERSRTRTDDVTSMVQFFEREIDEMAAALD